MKSQAPHRHPLRRAAVIFGAVALVGVAACASQVDAPPAPVEVQTQSHRHYKSPVTVLIDTVRLHGDLSAEQAELLDIISAELDESRDGKKALHDALRLTAVDVVRAGNADAPEFAEAVAQALSAIEAHVESNSDAVEEIHAMLEPDQRTMVAAALRARLDEKFGRARAEDTAQVARRRDGVGRFVTHLALSTFQVDQLMAIKKELVGDGQKLRPSRDELGALVDAFEGDDFRTALDALHERKAKLLRAHVARVGDRTDTVLSIFTPEQRDLLADLILDGPSKVLYGEAPQH
jgi:hypothetical protein